MLTIIKLVKNKIYLSNEEIIDVNPDIIHEYKLRQGDDITDKYTDVLEARFNIMYGTGISKEGEILDLAIELQICKKSGAWFSYGDTKLGQGKINVENLLKENKELFEEIKAKVLEKLNVNNNKVSEE